MSTSRQLRAVAVLTAGTILFSLFACDSGPTEPESVPTEQESVRLVITTDKTMYTPGIDYAATPILVNAGRDTVYVLMGEYVHAERWIGNGWAYAASWFVVDGVGPSFPLAPGDTLAVVPMRFDYVGRRLGKYRFVFAVAYDREMRRPLPKEKRVSTTFELVSQQR